MRSLLVLLLIGCSSKTPPASPNVSNTTGPAGSLTDEGSAFLGKMLDAAANEDCDKFAASLEALGPDAKALRAHLVASNQKFIELTLNPDLVQRAKAGELERRIMACDKVGSRTGAALQATVDVVDPNAERDMGWGTRGRASFGQGK